MANWDDVRRIALELPETSEDDSREALDWRVKGKVLAWERPLGRKDVEDLTRLGAEVPDGPILATRVTDLGVKEALLADDPEVFFTTPHFDGYPAVLIRLDRISIGVLTEVVTDAWLRQAPKRLAAHYLARRAVSPGEEG